MEARCGAAWAFAGVLLLVSSGRAEDDAAARKIIDQAIEAAGGRKALERYQKPFYQDRKGKVAVGNGRWNEFTLQSTTWLPDKLRTDQKPITNPNNRPFSMRVNGEKGCFGPPTREMDAVTLRGQQDLLYARWLATLLPMDDAEFQLTQLDEIMLDERPAVGVKVSRNDRPDVRLYFDKEAMTLVKLARESNGKLFEETYDDFAELDGLVYPKKTVQYALGKKSVEMETIEFKFLDEVDDVIFDKP